MKSEFPIVSCLMPTKNRRKFIPAALKMFFSQDYAGEMELIVIEDGEDDVSELITRFLADSRIDATRHDSSGPEYLPRFPTRFKVEYDRFEGTLGAKLNYGRDVARGEVLLNLDDDDWNSPTRVSDQVTHIRITGKPFVGMSSLIFYEDGKDFGWEYTGDAWYAPGSTHCYTREYALANPRPDLTVGEDNVAAERAKELGAISTISGLTCLVARDHAGNCSARLTNDTPKTEMQSLVIRLREEGLIDQYKKIPLDKFRATIQAAR